MSAIRTLGKEAHQHLNQVTADLEAFNIIWNVIDNDDDAKDRKKNLDKSSKEIKNIKKRTDEIKKWLESNETYIKDKQAKALHKACEDIEKEIERFKNYEKKPKIKPFSKEGLEWQPKAEKAKSETTDWLKKAVSSLESQLEKFTFELEPSVIHGRVPDSVKSDLMSSIDRLTTHISKLEVMMRMLDNDVLTPEQLNDVKESVDWFVEGHQEDFDVFEDEVMAYNLSLGIGNTGAVSSTTYTGSTSAAQFPATPLNKMIAPVDPFQSPPILHKEKSVWTKHNIYKNTLTGEQLRSRASEVDVDDRELEILRRNKRKDLNRLRWESEKKVTIVPDAYIQVKRLLEDEVHERISNLIHSLYDRTIREQEMHLHKYLVPSRRKGDLIFDRSLDRNCLLKGRYTEYQRPESIDRTGEALIYLQGAFQDGKRTEKRAVFYSDVNLHKDQGTTDHTIEDISLLCDCTRSSLKIFASPKGLIIGALKFLSGDEFIDCMESRSTHGVLIPADVDEVYIKSSDARFVLVVEKETVFFRLCEDQVHKKFNCIMVTAHGMPDMATRYLLKKLRDRYADLPFYGLMDFDPSGFKILSVYRYGAENLAYDSGNMAVKGIQLLGITHEDILKYKIHNRYIMEVDDEQVKSVYDLMKSECVFQNEEWLAELQWMATKRIKVEIEAFTSSHGLGFISGKYLQEKLETLGFAPIE